MVILLFDVVLWNDVGACVGSGASSFCGATTESLSAEDGGDGWQLLGNKGLYMDIDTSVCGFRSRAFYVASLVGAEAHWQLTGSAATSLPTRRSLRVVVAHPLLRGSALLRSARVFRWRVAWIGDTGANAGMTPPGATGWIATKYTTKALRGRLLRQTVHVCRS